MGPLLGNVLSHEVLCGQAAVRAPSEACIAGKSDGRSTMWINELRSGRRAHKGHSSNRDAICDPQAQERRVSTERNTTPSVMGIGTPKARWHPHRNLIVRRPVCGRNGEAANVVVLGKTLQLVPDQQPLPQFVQSRVRTGTRFGRVTVEGRAR